MRFPDRLIRRREDPTREWGAAGEAPPFDVWGMRLGSLRFFAPLDSAAFLGRPDRFRWTARDCSELVYARGGFQVDFEAGRFVYLAFFIGPDPFVPDVPALVFSRPRVTGLESGEARFSAGTTRAELERLFGAPRAQDTDDMETILFYTRRGIGMEFEFAPAGGLKRWNLSATGESPG